MDLKLTTDHDLEITNLDLVLNSGIEATRQRIMIALLTFKGEWLLDTDKGVPYFQTIFRKGVTKDIVDSTIRREVRKVQGVKSVQSLTSTLDNRTREYTCNFVAIDDGGTPIEINL